MTSEQKLPDKAESAIQRLREKLSSRRTASAKPLMYYLVKASVAGAERGNKRVRGGGAGKQGRARSHQVPQAMVRKSGLSFKQQSDEILSVLPRGPTLIPLEPDTDTYTQDS